jgi:hypothetical protein
MHRMTRDKRTTREIATAANVTAPGLALLQGAVEPDAFLGRLVENQLHADAIRFTAHRLPRPEALWWGCLCVWEVSRPKPTPAAETALGSVIEWLKDPSELRRRHAEQAGHAAGMDTPAGLLALAVFMSGGSISAPKLPEVAPDPLMTAKLVANAVLMASRTQTPETTLQRQFFQMARDVAEGRSHWAGRANR